MTKIQNRILNCSKILILNPLFSYLQVYGEFTKTNIGSKSKILHSIGTGSFCIDHGQAIGHLAPSRAPAPLAYMLAASSRRKTFLRIQIRRAKKSSDFSDREHFHAL
jgi:hypothetical protein